jgi:hypothetical protein
VTDVATPVTVRFPLGTSVMYTPGNVVAMLMRGSFEAAPIGRRGRVVMP